MRPRHEAERQGHGLGQEGRAVADMGPEFFEVFSRAFAAAFGEAAGQQGGVDRAGAGARKGVEGDALFFEQALERAPGEGAESRPPAMPGRAARGARTVCPSAVENRGRP